MRKAGYPGDHSRVRLPKRMIYFNKDNECRHSEIEYFRNANDTNPDQTTSFTSPDFNRAYEHTKRDMGDLQSSFIFSPPAADVVGAFY